jgi:ABC-type uncharacterized transport system permease subunit
MAATPQIVDRGAAGDLAFRIVDVTLDGNYPAGGYPLTAQQLALGLNGLIYLVLGSGSKTAGWESGWDYTNNKLQVFDSSGAASVAMHEVAPSTVLTGVVCRLLVMGKGQG